VAVTSKDPTSVGFALLMFDADMVSEVVVPLSLRAKLFMFISADLIASEVRFLGTSASGIEALIPEALGKSRCTFDVICDEIYC
jgi:hypothetical protein